MALKNAIAAGYCPELKLIGHILDADWAPGGKREWPVALFRSLDWPRFAGLAWQHKVRPMAVAALQEAGWPGAPSDVRENLEREVAECTGKAALQLEVHRAIARACEAAGIRCLALKGLALSVHLYRDPFIREAYDLDLLVSPGDTGRMRDVLGKLGFPPGGDGHQLTKRQTAILDWFFHEEKFVHPQTGAVVEVHHALTDNPWRVAADFEDLWERRQHLRVMQTDLAIPNDADLLRYLSAHAATHAWERWKWVGDLIALYRRMDVRPAPGTAGNGDLNDSAVLIAHEIAARGLPEALVAPAAENRRAVRLARRALESSSRPLDRNRRNDRRYALRVQLFRLRLRSHPGYIGFELAKWMHRPEDWRELQLPDALIPVHYLLRPVLFVGRLFLGRRISLSRISLRR